MESNFKFSLIGDIDNISLDIFAYSLQHTASILNYISIQEYKDREIIVKLNNLEKGSIIVTLSVYMKTLLDTLFQSGIDLSTMISMFAGVLSIHKHLKGETH